jgi:hypothetical protein
MKIGSPGHTRTGRELSSPSRTVTRNGYSEAKSETSTHSVAVSRPSSVDSPPDAWMPPRSSMYTVACRQASETWCSSSYSLHSPTRYPVAVVPSPPACPCVSQR